jgi:hypothetical protein
MKRNDMLLLGAVGIAAAYLLYSKSKETQPTEAGATGGSSLPFVPDVGAAFDKFIKDTQNLIPGNGPATPGNTAYPPSLPFGGQNQVKIDASSASALANVDYLNTALGAQYIQAAFNTSGNNLYLTGASGVPVANSQALIDAAIRAIPQNVPLYGITPNQGGATVFNIGAPVATISVPASAIKQSGGSGSSSIGSALYSGVASGFSQVASSPLTIAKAVATAPAQASSAALNIASAMARGLK